MDGVGGKGEGTNKNGEMATVLRRETGLTEIGFRSSGWRKDSIWTENKLI